MVQNFEHLLLCTDETVVTLLGRSFFTIFMRSTSFISEQVVTNAKILNELIHWALRAKEITTRVQCKCCCLFH